MNENEKVLCVENEAIPTKWLSNRAALPISEEELATSIQNWLWKKRLIAEKDPSCKQLIPYAVLKDLSGNIGCYRRSGSEKRLHGLWSLGVGGHINPEDMPDDRVNSNITTIIRNALFREIDEEFHIFKEKIDVSFAGIIHENETNVGLVHLGVVFACTVENPDNLVPAEELSDFKWFKQDHIKRMNFELWSTLALTFL